MKKLISWFLVLIWWLLPVAAFAQSSAPAEMTEISQQDVSLKASMGASPGGVDTSIADLIRGQQFAKLINNLQMSLTGVWTSRGIGWTAFGPNTNELINGMGSFYDRVNISTNGQACIRSLNGTAILCNGVQNPFFCTQPVLVGSLAGWPVTIGSTTHSAPAFCEPFQNRMAFAGFAANPYTVVFSQFNTVTGYATNSPAQDTDAGAIRVPSQLGPITGLFSLRIGTSISSNVTMQTYASNRHLQLQ